MKRSKEEVQEMYTKYSTGMSKHILNKEYKTDCEYLFKRDGLATRNLSKGQLLRTNKIKYKKDFKTIDTEEDAYILGLTYADGNISDCYMRIVLKPEDKYLLQKINNYLTETSIIYNHGANKFPQLVISNTSIVNNLKLHGITKQKSKNNFSIPNIPERLMYHFIRGYFDGDGTIYMDGKYLRWSICSPTLNILEGIRAEIDKLNILTKINTEKRKGKTLKCFDHYVISSTDMNRLYVRGQEDLKILYNYLYKDATIFLTRKKVRFDVLFK